MTHSNGQAAEDWLREQFCEHLRQRYDALREASKFQDVAELTGYFARFGPAKERIIEEAQRRASTEGGRIAKGKINAIWKEAVEASRNGVHHEE